MSLKIRVVEDSPVVRQTIRTALEHDGHEVTESGDGKRALACRRTAAPQLVITDVYKAGTGGLALIRAIRTLPVFRFVPMFVLTTETGEAMKQRGGAAGATGWVVVKPFEPDQLPQVVSRLIRPEGAPA